VALVGASFASTSFVGAQQLPPNTGLIVGIVAKCVNNVEQPLQGASVTVSGLGMNIITDSNGQFALALPAGQYTVTVNSSDGTSSRPNIPLDAGEILDVGTLDVGPAAVTGCGPDEQQLTPSPTPSALPTLELTPTPTSVPPTATPVPPTATPVPDQSSPDMTPPDQTSPDQTSPDQTSPDQTSPDSGG
jgi:hypothetical protein